MNLDDNYSGRPRGYQAPVSPNASYQDQRNYQQEEPMKNENNFNNSNLYEHNNDQSINGNVPNNQGHFQDHSKHDFFDMLCGQVNQALVVPKAFYFFFFAAFGSLFPLMAIYFKQMAMSPIQVGILFGLKPFMEFIAAPFWAYVGKKWRKAKLIFLFSLICWIGFTLGLGFIHPPVHSCLMHNETHLFFVKTTDSKILNQKTKRSAFDAKQISTSKKFDLHDLNKEHRNKRSIEKTGDNTYIDSETHKQWRVVNVTRIIRIRKTTTPKTTNKLEHIVEFRPPGGVHTPIKDEDYVKAAKTSAITKLVRETLSTEIHEKTTPETVVNAAISTAITNFNKLNKTTNAPNKLIPNLPNIGSITLPISLDLATPGPNPKQVEIKNFFDKGDLESAKKKGKIVYVDQPDMNLLKPTLETSVVYHRDDVQKIFMIFLVFILAGEFVSAPAITLADTYTMNLLGPNRQELYGRQRMFGSLGWAISMFAVGIILDNARIFTHHPCGKAGPDERNYSVCFAIFAVFMGFAFVVATQFKFDYGDEEGIPLKSMANNIKNKIKNPQFNPKIFVNEDEDEGSNINNQPQQAPPLRPEPMESENTTEKYLKIFQLCKSIKYASFLFIVWFMGIGVGLVFTFLFWHLQDMGGTPTLYGIASVINHLSELMAYFFVNQLVRKYGHINIFYAGLFGNALRFVYVSVLTEPIWILPFEFIQGLTHALVWASATSYFAQSIPIELRSTAQGILQGLHFGLGRGSGALLGGFLIQAFGSKITFFVYGFVSLLTMFCFIAINRFASDLVAKQNPQYTPNQFVNDLNDEKQIPDLTNVTNPMMNDTNFYYQSDNQNNNNDSGRTSFPVMTPHGVPTSNQNWNNQFSNNDRFY